ncbi:GDYXXLXY domain-containing protein [Bosea sp. BH3]|uniref:GDYXXLXY domain-containing protein n=1 Tax=Bosea sp. BH3 TaxID=2871701 RepID=UPI0021CB3722|nr:GDYXXLXY domain-containing protein [Bosea sp. BH3]MCU4180470.1 GDYXXLXY domain-containing protein [Bosea sp. BH3]
MRALSADALIAKVPLAWRALATVLLLALVLLALVEQRARILRSGAEIRLRTVPIDPRDLFRGDYVVLAYPISTVEAEAGGERYRRGEKVYVALQRDAEGFAQAASVSREWPRASGDAVVIAGQVTTTGACALNQDGTTDCNRRRLRVTYGLESFFVPQGEGKVIETTDKARIEVVASVSSSGAAAIKRLLIDGKPVYAEPPY